MTEDAHKQSKNQQDLHVVVLGLNHITAPVELRDRAYFSGQDIKNITRVLLAEDGFHEVVVFSTCNRSEIYAVTSRTEGRERILEKAWAGVKQIGENEIRSHSYYCRDLEAVIHLFRVASSLDSLVVGENQILGQVKEAYELACKNNSVDFYLNYIFQDSFRVGKRVRAETTLNEGAVSISYAAVELAKKVLGEDLKDRTVGVVGSGEMGELTAFHLNRAGASRFIFFNRSLNKAEKLAARFGGDIYTLPHMEERLFQCDIIIASTGSREPVILKEHVEKAVRMRGGKPVFLIDIAAPRDIAEDVQEVRNAFLFTIDDLKKVVGENLFFRREASEKAMDIIREEASKVEAWYKNLDLAPVIQKLRDKFEAMARQELERQGRGQPEEIRRELEKLSRSLLGKFLHLAISGLKKMGGEGDGRRAGRYAEQIFDLGDGGEE